MSSLYKLAIYKSAHMGGKKKKKNIILDNLAESC